jgi:hypothetical protein
MVEQTHLGSAAWRQGLECTRGPTSDTWHEANKAERRGAKASLLIASLLGAVGLGARSNLGPGRAGGRQRQALWKPTRLAMRQLLLDGAAQASCAPGVRRFGRGGAGAFAKALPSGPLMLWRRPS